MAWPEFRVAWLLLVLIAGAFGIAAAGFSNDILLASCGILLLVVLILSMWSAYRSAMVARGTKVERTELESILGILNDAVIVYEEGFRATFFNPAAERLFQVHAKSIIGHVFAPQDVEREGWRTLIQVIFPSLAPRVITRSKEGEYPQVLDVAFTNPSLEFRITTSPIADDDGKTVAFMKIVRDRTALVAALRSRSEFVTVASHQLRGPVTDISWALESLARADELNDADRSIVQNATAASQGLLRRIEDLLNISKMEEGQFGYNFEELDIAEFIGKILADVLPSAKQAGIKIYFDRPSADLPHVMIDPKRLSLAVINLLENAIRYNVENGEVIVKVDRIEGKPYIQVSVKDTGIGIPAESMEKLFNRFYRAENAMKSQTEGSGLGLYIAKSIVTAHGGEIWAESELNRGTVLYFTLPTDPSLIPKHEVGAEELY